MTANTYTKDKWGNAVTPWGPFGADTYRWTNPASGPDLSLPPQHSVSVAHLSSPDGIRFHVYCETLSWCTMLLYHDPTQHTGGRLVHFRLTKKDGSVHKGSAALNSCRAGEVKKNAISASGCSHAQLITKAEYDALHF